jgi:REP element-mobilizing transposase RayT
MPTKFEPGKVEVHRRKKLPHWDARHGTQFVTFETSGLHFDAETALLIVETLLHDDEHDYALLAWCVMPNHVHVVLRTEKTIASLVKTWKSVSARKINARLGTKGPVWRADYWDRLIRDSDELEKTIEYVLVNSITAKLNEWPHFRSYPERI